MRWNKEGVRQNDQVMVHLSDNEAWNALYNLDAGFTMDVRNVQIGLATDGFMPHNSSTASYSCWTIFAIPYNLSPALCMKYKYMLLCHLVPGPDHPGPRMNMMLKPLIEELKQLWEGVEAYDYDQKQKFNLWVAYLWSVHDFKSYNIFAGWSCNGILTCSICGGDTTYFCLKSGGKISYFDCHRQFLP
jgi:hypothetical protein